MALVGGVFPYGMPELPVAIESSNSNESRSVADSLLAQLLPPDVAQCLQNLTHEKRNMVILALIQLQKDEVRLLRTRVRGFD
jgi:Mg/Co/Ni transporter MgtE